MYRQRSRLKYLNRLLHGNLVSPQYRIVEKLIYLKKKILFYVFQFMLFVHIVSSIHRDLGQGLDKIPYPRKLKKFKKYSSLTA